MLHTIKYFLVLIRWFHELLALFPFVVLYFIIDYRLSLIESSFHLNVFNFILFCLGVQSIMVPNFILNDLVDYPIDVINKPNRHVVGRMFSVSAVKNLFWIFSIFNLLLCFFISWYVFPLWALINPCIFFISIAYNLWLKKTPLFGNISIALLGALVPLTMLYYLELPLKLINDEKLYVLIFVYSSLLFLVTIPRELSLDISDIEGDKANGCKTLPILIGKRKSKLVVSFFMLVVITLSILASLWYRYLLPPFIVMDLLFIYFSYRLWKTETRQGYVVNGRIVWGAMMWGIVGATVTTLM